MKKHIPAILAALLIVFMFSACPIIDTSEYGSLILSFLPTDMQPKTIVPGLDMNVSYYEASGLGPNTSTFSQAPVGGTTIVENSLGVGTWVVTVNAFNSADASIGTGSDTILVQAGQTAIGSIAVTPIVGTGNLNVAISWPNTSIASPNITAVLANPAGTPIGETTSDINGGLGTASYTYDGLATGYYSLIIQLKDDTTLTWGSYEAVRIVNAQDTNATFDVSVVDVGGGGLNVTIIPDMQDPITIDLYDNTQTADLIDPVSVVTGADIDVVANPSEAVDYYTWYLEGALIAEGAVANNLVYGEIPTPPVALPPGTYRIDVGVKSGSLLSSATFDMEVTP
jgi:hypothetical protein